MDCEQSNPLISRLIDKEIDPIDRERLESHLQDCAPCRATVETLRHQDVELRSLFAPGPARAAVVAERVIAQVRLEPRHGQPRFRWLAVVASLASAAASFLAALLIFQPWVKPERLIVERTVEVPVVVERVVDRPLIVPALDYAALDSKPQVQLALTTGIVEMHSPDEKDWKVLEPGTSIDEGTLVRTRPAVRCEFRCPDGSEVRLNGDTALYFITDRRFLLQNGQVMSNVVKGEVPFQVETADALVTALDTQFDLNCKPRETVLTVVQGQTRVEGKSKSKKEAKEEIVKSGEVARIVDGQVTEKDRAYPLMQTTNWVNELLLLKRRDNTELQNRVNGLLAELGQAKVDILSEDEIRALGDHCVVPLTRFVQSPNAKKSAEQRRFAARILADLAQPWSIPELISLLQHEDGEVRFHAAKALERLTARDGAMQPGQWRKLSLAACKSEYEIWKSWWEDNKYRYPKAP